MSADTLKQRILAREARVAVIGCGYVGLPLAIAFAKAGFGVVGIEVDEGRVDALRRGDSYIMDVASDDLREQTSSGRFSATSDYDALREVDIMFVSVPTPFDKAKRPDLSFIVAAAEGIASRLHADQLIVLESTTFPGTTEEVMRPILERSGLRAGEDFYLAFSPERIDPGNRDYRIDNTPKVVGGIDAASTELTVAVLEQVVRKGLVHAVSTTRAAELTKLLENTFRAVNIALVNELAMLCDRMEIDIWEVIEAASTKPYGFMSFFPSPGVGGHCIPVDPYYLYWKAREFDFHTKFIELAAETNVAMPFFTVGRVRRLLNRHGRALEGARILALGAAFKKDIDDARNSAAIRVMEILQREGALVDYHDPHVPRVVLSRDLYRTGRQVTLESIDLDDDKLAVYDCIVILVAHSQVDYGSIVNSGRLVFDAVNATRAQPGAETVERL